MPWRCVISEAERCLVRAILLSVFFSLGCSAAVSYADPGSMEVDVECSQEDGLFVSLHQVCAAPLENDMQRLRLRLRPECVNDSLAPPARHAELSVSVLSSLANDPKFQDYTDITTTATIGVSLLITLFCFWRPHTVDALLLPVETFQHVQLRSRAERVAEVTFVYLLLTPMMLLYQLTCGMFINAVLASALLVYVINYRPSYDTAVLIFNVWVFVCTPLCVLLAVKGVIQWNGYASCITVASFGAVLHDLPSQQLRAAVFVNAIHLFTGMDVFLFGTFFSTFAVMIKATLRSTLRRWMSDSQLVACLSTVVLVSLALCRLQDAYSSQIYAVLQDHAFIAKAFASTIALLLAFLCHTQGQVVDNLLLPAGAAACRHEQQAEAVLQFYGICLFSLAACYQLSYGMWSISSMSIVVLLWVQTKPKYASILRMYELWQFVGTPIVMLLVVNGVIHGRGWSNIFVIPTMGGMMYGVPSQQLRGSLFHIALLVLKAEMHSLCSKERVAQVAATVVLGFVATVLSIRAKTTLLQRELYDMLEQAKLNEAQHEIECMKAKLEGQQEVVAQVSHLLHSPIAALDYQVRLLNPEEPFVGPIKVCMNLIMEISSLFTQHPELCAKMSSTLDTKQQLSSELPPEQCHASSKHAQVSKKVGAIKLTLRGSNRVFMLVDDVQCLRQAQKSHLQKLVTQWDSDFVFCEAATGEECISEISSRGDAPPHVVIIDQYMHDAGGNLLGSTTVRQLRHNGFEGLIIGCSGNAECEKLFMDAGADRFWGKPGPSDSVVSELLEHELCLVKSIDTAGKDSIQTNRAAQEVHDRHQKSVAQIIHDLGTPIQTLKLAFEANDRDAVNISIQTLTQLRSMLVNEAKLSFGESIDPRKDPCNLMKVLEDLKLMMRSTIESYGLNFTIEVPDTLQNISINTDASMLMSMLCNLISNAAKHSKSSILVQLCVLEERMLRVQVHDDGLGVPKSFQGQLFHYFQCLQRGDGNTGLGLTSVAAQSAALGGRCGYDDSLSLVGAMFWFEIPFSAVPTEKQASKNKASRVSYDVLVVDDSMSLRQTVKLLLEQSGCTVSTAAGGDAALAQMQQRHDLQQGMFSVVLCDVQMAPHMSGYEMTSALREWESGLPTSQKQPVVLMSGDASEAAAQRGYEYGANAYICKPVDFDELLRVLDDVVLRTGSVDSKPAMAIEQLLEEPREVLQLDSTIHGPTVVDARSSNIVPAVEFCDALRLVYGLGVQDLLTTLVDEIREGLAALQTEKTAGAAHKLKGLFGALYLKDAFDECELIHRLYKSQLDGNHEDIKLHTQNVVCLFEKSMVGQILPDRDRFFDQKKRAANLLQ